MSRRFAPGKFETQAARSHDPVELRELALRSSSFVRSAVARNPHTDIPTLRSLAETGDKYVLSAVASNPSASADLLVEVLARAGEDDYVRAAVASHPSASAMTLRHLHDHSDPRVRRGVASNPACPSGLLSEFAADPDEGVRAAAAKHPNTPDSALMGLCEDTSSGVIRALGLRHSDRNTNYRTVVVQRRGAHRHFEAESVRIPIEVGGRFSPTLIAAFAASPHLSLHKVAASQPDAPLSTLRDLAAHVDPWVRVRVAENPASGEDVLLRVVAAGGSDALVAVAAREDLSPEVVAVIALTRVSSAHAKLGARAASMLLSDERPAVRASAAKVLTGDDVEQLMMMATDESVEVRKAGVGALSSQHLPGLASSACKQVRAIVAERSCDTSVLDLLSSDSAAVVRRRVARNRQTSHEALSRLASDEDARTRSEAAERFLRALSE